MADFAFDSDVKCLLCGEPVNLGDDLRSHLIVTHAAGKMLNKLYNDTEQSARNKIKQDETVKRNVPDTVTLDRIERDDKNNFVGEQLNQEDKLLEEDDLTEEDDEKDLKHFVGETMSKLFAPLIDIIDGKVDLDNNDEVDDDEEYDPDMADEKISECFSDLRNILLSKQHLIIDAYNQSKNKSVTIEEECAAKTFSCKDCSKEFEEEIELENHITNSHSIAKDMLKSDTDTSKISKDNKPTMEENVIGAPLPPVKSAGSVGSIPSDQPSKRPRLTTTTTFLCPLDKPGEKGTKCTFSLTKDQSTKDQMRSGSLAASHISEYHRLSNKDIMEARSNGRPIRFNKVKTELAS